MVKLVPSMYAAIRILLAQNELLRESLFSERAIADALEKLRVNFLHPLHHLVYDDRRFVWSVS